MIAIARKNLFSLFVSPNSFLRNSNVHFLFSTSTSSSEFYDVLVHKHKLSFDLVSLAASHSPQYRVPKNADLVLSFLEQNSFTSAQLEKLVAYNPRILGFPIERIALKLKLFQDLGIPSEEIAKIMSSSLSVLHSSAAKKLIPSLSMLKGLVGSNRDVARLVGKSPWFLTADLEKSLLPNVEMLKNYGIPMEHILRFLYSQPRCFLAKPDILRKSVDKALQFGVSPTQLSFIHAAKLFNYTSDAIWEDKLQTFRDLGFSDDDIFTMFRRAPSTFSQSTKKMRNATELLLATGNYNISDIITVPLSLGLSIEMRLEPRLQILGLLQSRNLIEKWPSLSVVASFTDDRFFDKFVRPYSDEIGKECIMNKYVKAKTDED